MSGFIIAGTHSGSGKTTITLGLLAALKKKGLSVQAFKAGPDFIDSGLHRLITGRPSRNLDIWMCGEGYVLDCFYKNSADVDISVIEGVMGFYDGEFSTAKLAEILGLPVILVVDAYGMAESAGAVVKGFVEYGSTAPKIAGVIFNRVASAKHYERLKKSVQNIKVLGYLPRDLNFEIPHRHLGLKVAEENPIALKNIERLADTVLENIDVELLIQKRAEERKSFRIVGADQCVCPNNRGEHIGSPLHNFQTSALSSFCSNLKIAVAYDRAFCFYYEDNLDLLREAGSEIVTFSPLTDPELPSNVDVIYIGGGYPEIYAERLSENLSLLKAIKDWAEAGKPIYAECGGLMYLSNGIYDFDGKFYKMAGIFPFDTIMKKERSRLGYREVQLKEDCILGNKGDIMRGHEFHYSEIRNSAEVRKCGSAKKFSLVYSLKNNLGEHLADEGYRYKNTIASYVHLHFGSNPHIAEKFLKFITSHVTRLTCMSAHITQRSVYGKHYTCSSRKSKN